MKVHKDISGVEYWYDPHVRSWWAMAVDQGGNQIGDAVHSYTKTEIVRQARFLARETNDEVQST